MKLLDTLRSNFTANIVCAVVQLLLVFGILVGVVGYISFTDAFKEEYASTTYHMADTASILVKGDEIDSYLQNGGNSDSYRQTKRYLDSYCLRMNLSLVYVIKVDTSDYGSFVSVINCVGKDTPYTEWEVGHYREAENKEYINTYRDLYNGAISYGTIYRTRNLRNAPPHITTLVPVKNSEGKVVSLLCVQRPMEALTASRRPYLITIAFSTILLMMLTAFAAAFYMRSQFVVPIRKVIDEAKRFASENSAGEKLGDNISHIADISVLAASIDTMETEMLRYIENLNAETAEKERIGAELSLAASIQAGSIPHVFPAFPDRSDFDIYASMTPAKEIGGDFYNFYMMDDDHLALTIADVSGKGIPAALFMMVTNILINDRAHFGGSPAEILTFVNHRILEYNPAEMFVTVWLGVIEMSTGRLIAANAGHEHPALKRADGKFELLKENHGLVLGALESARYRDVEIYLKPGDKLFIYTDGIPEATNGEKNMFGLENMLDALNQHKDESPQEIIEGVKERVNAFIGDEQPFDDLTALCFELKESGVRRLTVDASVDKLGEVMDFIEERLNECGFSPKDILKTTLSAEEIFVNIAHYAYSGGEGTADVIFERRDGEIALTFQDRGTPFDPLKKPDPDISLDAEDRPIGGLGIFLCKKNMDSVTYAYRDGCNVLCMTKKMN
ncbi:SpoIIE family protein phosphatase [Ruminococcus sp.]|uniref:ATP-binding SpoIIE family protein phosphatase n=1 Tax=Ruminococcus sp. TaxID=41978 RepID=UPI00388DA6D6